MKRVPFGLRCSLTLLNIALHKILLVDTEDDTEYVKEVKKLIHSLMYVDNGAVSANDTSTLRESVGKLTSIFSPYQFSLQQYITNNVEIQSEIDNEFDVETPITNKLLGTHWDRVQDTLSPVKFSLNESASTKREVLSSIASNYDLFNVGAPMMNRARIFLHGLQCRTDLKWDATLNPDDLKLWKNIAKQLNSSMEISIPRFIGSRTDSYKLLAFVDSSCTIYGAVLFIQSNSTGNRSFLSAKNRLISKNMDSKKIPSLELQSVTLGVEMLIEARVELTINGVYVNELLLFTDSMVCMNWLNLYSNKFEKFNKKSVFVRNRLETISKYCEKYPVQFEHCAGAENPADALTRCLSYKQLMKSNYLSGQIAENFEQDALIVKIPNPMLNSGEYHVDLVSNSVSIPIKSPLINITGISTFCKVIGIYKYVLKFVDLLKSRIANRFQHIGINNDDTIHTRALQLAILQDQHSQFSDIHQYFDSKSKNIKDIPNLISQLNVFRDKSGLLRVKCKLKSGDRYGGFPILMSKNSYLTKLLILEAHGNSKHSGIYSVLTELRPKFWIPSCFSLVKKTIRGCIHCRRMNNRAIQVNQNAYRKFRSDPPEICFRSLFLDYIGPFHVKLANKKVKVYLLCFTCLWSRGVNIEICRDLTIDNFLRAFQLHCFKYGIPELCMSDLGSQIVPGSKIIEDFLSDSETLQYFNSNGVKPIKSEQFPKGCKELGGNC